MKYLLVIILNLPLYLFACPQIELTNPVCTQRLTDDNGQDVSKERMAKVFTTKTKNKYEINLTSYDGSTIKHIFPSEQKIEIGQLKGHLIKYCIDNTYIIEQHLEENEPLVVKGYSFDNFIYFHGMTTDFLHLNKSQEVRHRNPKIQSKKYTLVCSSLI